MTACAKASTIEYNDYVDWLPACGPNIAYHTGDIVITCQHDINNPRGTLLKVDSTHGYFTRYIDPTNQQSFNVQVLTTSKNKSVNPISVIVTNIEVYPISRRIERM